MMIICFAKNKCIILFFFGWWDKGIHRQMMYIDALTNANIYIYISYDTYEVRYRYIWRERERERERESYEDR